MSKAKIGKQLKEQFGAGNIPVELIALEPIGAEVKRLIHEQMEVTGERVYFSQDERKGMNPLRTVGQTDLEVTVNGVTLKVRQAEDDKPSVVIPVGKSDVTTTMALDHKYNYSFLIASLRHAFGGNMDRVQEVVNLLNEVQDEAMVTNESGRTSIDKAQLPEIQDKERIDAMVESLTRRVKSRSKGTIQTNVSVTVEGLETPVASPVTRSDIIATPTHESPTSDPVVHPTEEMPPSIVVMGGEGQTVRSITSEEGVGVEGDTPAFSAIVKQREQITDALSSVLSLGDLTIGAVRKGMAELGLNDDDWRPRFDALLKAGWIVTNGASGRSCRYNWMGDE